MIGIHRFLTLIRDLSPVVGFGIIQKQRDILIQRRMIVLERHDILSVLLGDGLGHVLVTAHRLNRDNAALQV